MNLFETVKTQVTLKQAALKLVRDFGLARPGLSQTDPVIPTKTFRDRERHALRVMEAHLKLLKLWKTAYEPKSPEEPEGDRFVTACQMMDYDEYLIAELTMGTREEHEGKLKILEEDDRIGTSDEQYNANSRENTLKIRKFQFLSKKDEKKQKKVLTPESISDIIYSCQAEF